MLLKRFQETLETLIKYEKEVSAMSAQNSFYADSYKNKYYNEKIVEVIKTRHESLIIKIKILREELFE